MVGNKSSKRRTNSFKRRTKLSKRRTNSFKRRTNLSKRRNNLSKRRTNLSKRRSKVVKHINKRGKNYKNTNIYHGSFIGGETPSPSPQSPPPPESPTIHVFYRGENNMSGFIDTSYDSTFLDLLNIICNQHHINSDDYSLIYAGKGTNNSGGLTIRQLDGDSREIFEDEEMYVVLRKKN